MAPYGPKIKGNMDVHTTTTLAAKTNGRQINKLMGPQSFLQQRQIMNLIPQHELRAQILQVESVENLYRGRKDFILLLFF